MGFEWDMVPGERIGPFRLGMTEEEVQAAWRSVPGWAKREPEMSKGMPPQIGTSFVDGRCTRVEVRLDAKAPVTLGGVDLRERTAAAIEDEYAKFGKAERSYGSLDVYAAGLSATKWEASDMYFVSVEVMCKKP